MKLKIVRVVTDSYVVPWHLHNTLTRAASDFNIFVVGKNVSIYQNKYPLVNFIDIDINRKVSLLADLSSLFSLCKFLIAQKPDIIHSVMPKAGLISALSGYVCRTPVRIHTFTGQTWATETGLRRKFHYYIDKLINRLNTKCFTDSPSQSNFLFKNNIKKENSPLDYLSKGSLSGVDIKRFLPMVPSEKIIEELGGGHASTQNFMFAFIARKTLDKGAVDMLRAFSLVSVKFKSASLLFIGPDEDDIIKGIKKSQPNLLNNVIDIGAVSNHEEYLSLTDVLCLPSYREGFGSVVIDAAAMQVPTIGSNIPGLVDSIENNKTGFLFPVGDINTMSKMMIKFIETPNLSKSMGIDAKKRVMEYFTDEILYSELKKEYFELTRNEGVKIK